MAAINTTIRVNCEKGKSEQDEWKDRSPGAELIERRAREQFESVVELVKKRKPEQSFDEVEKEIRGLLFSLGRLVLALFLCCCQEQLQSHMFRIIEGRRYRRDGIRGRWLATFFGPVRYWRVYMRSSAGGGGYHPLDRELKIPSEGFSAGLSSLMARMATKMSYAQVTTTLFCFLGWTPCQASVEHAVLGLGRMTGRWFENAPLPEGDGDVLIIQIDGKATPTATESELSKRRGKRGPKQNKGSARHRARARRRARGKKRKKDKGDKSKNGRACTVVVIYTLCADVDETGKPMLKGPINKWVYASYDNKRHGFEVARREANRRGFTKESGKTIQLVTDGDEDYDRLAREFFPEAIHTLDVMHALEYLWDAARALFRKGSDQIQSWVEEQKDRIYRGKVEEVLTELSEKLQEIPTRGPGTKEKRECLETVFTYLAKRVDMMNYAELQERDLEMGSGAVEGAVRHVVAQRFDCGGMRWIRERAQALLQLRCIEINGHWDEFMQFVQQTQRGSPDAPLPQISLHAAKPVPLPTFKLAA